MAEFSGYKCDGPKCNNRVDVKDPEAKQWLKVKIATDSYHDDLTFDSLDCFERFIHDQRMSQRPE